MYHPLVWHEITYISTVDAMAGLHATLKSIAQRYIATFLALFYTCSIHKNSVQHKLENANILSLIMAKLVITSLISPIESLLNGQGEGPVVAMETLEWVGQLVGWLASSGSGRGTLLG